MKELRSRKYPHRRPQIVTDEEFAKLKEQGISSRFIVTEMPEVRQLIPTPKIIRPVIEVNAATNKLPKIPKRGDKS